MTPAHRATIAFARGGLFAIAALLASGRIGGLARDLPSLAAAFGALQLALPLVGFALAGAVGGASLGTGRRATLGFAGGCFLAGAVLSAAWPHLSGLTGHESLAAVLSFAAAAWAGAFGIAGAIGGACLARGRTWHVGAGFAGGGAVGAVLLVMPVLLAPAGLHAWPPTVQLAVTVTSSAAGLLAPFAIGGAAAGRAVDEGDGQA
ncbi:MAG: hypothetical protein EHM24_09340 [Acidobacteria bacterium]|nr:MAG: hypothetical protein EHM24_09340 [Acidobacteriota bacterium]